MQPESNQTSYNITRNKLNVGKLVLSDLESNSRAAASTVQELFYLNSDLCDLRREALFASEPFLFLPLLQCQAEDARFHLLGCNIQFTG